MRIRAKLTLVPTVLAVFLALPVHSEVARIEWADLVDETAQDYEDPFVELTGKQLSALRKLVRLRAQQEKGRSTPELLDQLQVDIEATEATLAEEGVDANWLISQRWVVMERREKAGTAANLDYDGVTVSLGGFVIPAPRDEDGSQMAYIVPERGMCSHVPPPPPNQMVRLHLSDSWAPSTVYEPIVVTGQIRIEATQKELLVVDGPVLMKAAFTLEVDDVQTFGPTKTSNEDSTNRASVLMGRKKATGGATRDD
ncbi:MULTISPECIES: DUF3299 domain-containing protein [unclassified Ruegeria]|uniref:DUF3299 domain-containing protein n=1 Tax=unclassified Ruegeria TaxID=2625375 RepID=UPI0014923B0D|nr:MULTISPECIES: DUF3299 domain-containing protein [unclassified Ruegeria]NOD91144.1 DUF3299 domain-containing protein [Ruegeria sp. HKCCD4318]NOE16436.1 DUF3299 domain-containing protein [Ruegeria sp. HKCCD4318-2]NOG07386.1 DUF3299 domain-containing protein [Ruegeria sp. HKCCD4315]